MDPSFLIQDLGRPDDIYLFLIVCCLNSLRLAVLHDFVTKYIRNYILRPWREFKILERQIATLESQKEEEREVVTVKLKKAEGGSRVS